MNTMTTKLVSKDRKVWRDTINDGGVNQVYFFILSLILNYCSSVNQYFCGLYNVAYPKVRNMINVYDIDIHPNTVVPLFSFFKQKTIR